jgi:FMN-dependent oxidoreductase (nitrilotriacetate monooxygenase family)
MPDRRIAMVGFLQAQNCSNFPASWRHPESAGDFMTPEYYRRIARTLEEGKFHLAFFDDRLAMPDRYGDDMAEALRQGIRVVKMDLIPLMTAMGLATSRIGLGGTYSTTYFEPFHVARVFSTLDHMIGGRAAWNVVTSLNDSEAANFGRTEHPPHDRRYDRADEFMEVVLGNWDTWEDGSVLYDRDGLGFADPARVHRLDYEGEWFRTRGTFTVPWTPQGRPVIIQAGQSGRGRAFAVRWAEVIFAIYPNLEFGARAYAETRALAESAGRDPDSFRIAPACYTTVGETQTMAEDKAAFVDKLSQPVDTLALLSEALNFDFATKAPDDPFTDEELRSISGLQAIRDRVIRLSGNPNPTRDDFVRYSNRGTVREMPHFVGTAATVADRLQEWFERPACDGFVLAATHVPGTYEDFVRLVVPELQRRGIYHRDYAGATLRENLGLAG